MPILSLLLSLNRRQKIELKKFFQKTTRMSNEFTKLNTLSKYNNFYVASVYIIINITVKIVITAGVVDVNIIVYQAVVRCC